MNYNVEIFTAKKIPSKGEQKIIDYLDKYKLEYILKPISEVTQADIIHMCSLENERFGTFLKSSFIINEDQPMSIFMNRLLQRKSAFKTPICLTSDSKLVIGVDDNQFINLLPKTYRKIIQQNRVFMSANNLTTESEDMSYQV